MTNLYNLTTEYQRLLAQDDYSDDDLKSLDSLHKTIEDRAVHYAYIIKELEGKLSATQDAIKTASEKKQRLQKNIERLEAYILDGLKVANIDFIDKDPMFDIKVKSNPPSVDDYEPTDIPIEYFVKKETLSLDKKKVKEDIENLGLVIPGVRLVRKVSLQIK